MPPRTYLFGRAGRRPLNIRGATTSAFSILSQGIRVQEEIFVVHVCWILLQGVEERDIELRLSSGKGWDGENPGLEASESRYQNPGHAHRASGEEPRPQRLGHAHQPG